jgi:hypothetical protein
MTKLFELKFREKNLQKHLLFIMAQHQQAQQLQQALIAHDRVLRTTNIPLFYSCKGKDTITPQQLVFQQEKASRINERQMSFTFLSEIMLFNGTTRSSTLSASTRRFGMT